MDLSPGAWALLGMLHRAKSGGAGVQKGFVLEYAELHANELITGNEASVVLTEKGEAALRERFPDK